MNFYSFILQPKRWRKQLCQVPFWFLTPFVNDYTTQMTSWLQFLHALHLVFVFLPVPFKLPKLFDLSEWELLLASPADPDFALLPFSKRDKRKHNTSRSGPVYSTYQHIWWNKDKHRQSPDKTTPPQTVPICGHFQDLNGEVCDAYLLWPPARARKLLWRPGLLLTPQPEPGGQEKKTQTEAEKQSTNLKASAPPSAVDRPRKLCMTIKRVL